MKSTVKSVCVTIAVVAALGCAFYIRADDKPDIDKLRKGAEMGNPVDQYNLGLMYQFNKDLPHDDNKAFQWYYKAAVHGHLSAEAKVCSAYLGGTGVTKNEVEGIKWCFDCAEKGNAFGQVIIGAAYGNALFGLTKSFDESIKWYRKAAEQGISVAQAELAYAYAKGIGGTPQDYVQADMWANLAAAQNDLKTPKVIPLRDAIERIMNPDQIAEARRLADNWRKQHPNRPM